MRRLMNEPNVRKIIHVNMDAVFASVKQRDGPALRGRPVTLGYAANEASSPLHKARTIGVSTGTVPVSDVPWLVGWEMIRFAMGLRRPPEFSAAGAVAAAHDEGR